MPSSVCQARTISTGEIQCLPCRRLWDADEMVGCPRDVPLVPDDEPTEWVSALAPDYLRD